MLEALCTLFPQADLFSLIADRTTLTPGLRAHALRTSPLQVLPGIRHYYRWCLPIFPWAIEQLPVNEYDLVISISHSVAKGVRPRPRTRTKHLCYCLTPMRYAWVFPDMYLGDTAAPMRAPAAQVFQYLRRWDLRTNQTVDQFVAISDTIRARIHMHYHREAEVIYPPVDCGRFAATPRRPQGYYLVVSALVPYKRIDLAIEACTRLNRPLVVVGTGPCQAQWQRLAGPTVRFVNWLSPNALAEAYAGAEALLHPQEEDFGIAAVEAQAAGCPVIAYGKGGGGETVVHQHPGYLFHEQTVDAVMRAMESAAAVSWDARTLQRHAQRFDHAVFVEQFRQCVDTLLSSPSI